MSLHPLLAHCPVVNPTIWLHAHQDDEVLTFGPGIESHVDAGRWVIDILVTDGAASSAKALVDAKLGYTLTPHAFSQARTREWLAAINMLGVQQAHTFAAPDGGLTMDTATDLVRALARRYPEGDFKAQSWADSHRDHATIGKAVQAAAAAGIIRKPPRYYLKREDRALVPKMRAWGERGGERTVAAAAEYARWDPAAGRYGIGYLSVPESFDAVAVDPSGRVHV